MSQANGSSGQFRPVDDILEEAAIVIQEQYQTRQEGYVLSEDVLLFTQMKCTRNALKNICDVKGQ